ncbi:MAG: DNA starvation/stationary phase protection protein [Gammaproteobacteria bacterium]|nr:DNA starvation/stationary phase protection protein [Gammaproteobacteria bacterium]
MARRPARSRRSSPSVSPAPARGVPSIDIGIEPAARRRVADGLANVLADSYTLYLKTHAFHWNVEGPMFNTLHQMFMEQYTELWNALDLSAERIRSLGFPAPGTYREFAKRSSIRETEGVPEAMEMVRLLTLGHEAVARTARDVLEQADAADDNSSEDLLIQRLQVHEKTAWMLRSLLR